MKKLNSLRLLGLLLLLAGLVFSSAPARAEMYVEGYLGGMVGSNNTFDIDLVHQAAPIAVPGDSREILSAPGKLNPAVLGGVKLGTWFVKEGFLGMNYPDWMKYFGFYLDFSFHRLDFRRETLNSNISTFRTGAAPVVGQTGLTSFWSEGTAATLAFMFAARYGFLADSEVPFGRLQPYVGVGPAIFFSSQEPAVRAVRQPVFGPLTVYQDEAGSQSSVDIALAAEAGIRYMALKNVSIDASFKYRYVQPTYEFNARDSFNARPNFIAPNGLPGRNTFSLDPTFHLFSFQVGAAYHF